MKKYALITGASGGIGKAIANELASMGYTLYLHYNQNERSVQQLAESLEKEGHECRVLQANLGQKDGIDILLQQIEHSVDTIVYNSGKSFFGLITDTDQMTIELMVNLHINAPFLLSKNLLPDMISRKKGNIVLISSIWGITGASCEVLYSMVKGGQNSFVKALAKEVAPSGIRVNAIAPGAIETNMLDEFTVGELADIAKEIPLGRIGKPEEVARAVKFLLSDDSSYITGQVLSVNGGWYC